jgi:Arc/MetJ-type ribon-helix-helix transcriptional regulator
MAGLKMKFRRRQKGIGVRLHSYQDTLLKKLAESEGYESVSDFVRIVLDRAIREHQKKLKEPRLRSPKRNADASQMKFRRREKQIDVRLHSDHHALLKELAESEGYESVSDFVRIVLDRAIKEHQKKLEEPRLRSPKGKSEASEVYQSPVKKRSKGAVGLHLRRP